MSADLLAVVTRTAALACLFQAAGVALFLLMFGRWLRGAREPILAIGRRFALAAIPLLALHQSFDAGRMAGSLSGLTDAGLERLAWQGASGLSVVLQILGMAAIAVSLRARAAPLPIVATTVAVIGAAVAVVAMVLTGHTSVHPERVLLTPLLALHVLLVAFWFGALLPLIVCCRRESGESAVALLRAFSGAAGWLVPCLGLAGLVMALTLMPHLADWRSIYARFILTKLGLFVVLLLLAAWNRWRAVPALAAGGGTRAGTALRRVVAVEYALIIAVLAVTATMTAFYSPQ